MNTSKRKQLSGVVSSNKMNSTVVVKVVRKIAHPVYKKYVNRTKKYYVHDPKNSCGVGDLVTIEESKPISKLKRWRIKLIQEKAVN